MKKLILLLSIFVSLGAFAQKVALDDYFTNSGGNYHYPSFDCDAGSIISFDYKIVCTGSQMNVVPRLYCYFEGNNFFSKQGIVCSTVKGSTSQKVQSSGSHSLSLYSTFHEDTGWNSCTGNISLTNVVINKSVTDSNNFHYLFSDDNNTTLTLVSPISIQNGSLELPENVSIPFVGFYTLDKIEENLLKNNATINKLSIPSTITEIGDSAFYGTSVSDVYCYATAAPKVTGTTFNKGTRIHVYSDSYWYDASVYSNYVIVKDLDVITEVQNIKTPESSSKKILKKGNVVVIHKNKIYDAGGRALRN